MLTLSYSSKCVKIIITPEVSDLMWCGACLEHAGIGAMTWSPLACGIISGKYNSGIPPYSRASLKVTHYFSTSLSLLSHAIDYLSGHFNLINPTSPTLNVVLSTSLKPTTTVTVCTKETIRNTYIIHTN